MITENKIAEIFCIIRQFGIRVHLKYLQQSGLLHMYRQCLRFVVEETISSKCCTQIHDEVVYRPVPGVDEICLVFQQVVDALDNISLVHEDLVPHGYEFVLHVYASSG